MKENNPIDELFKKQLGGHEIRPSEKVWDKIEAARQRPEPKAGGWYFMRAAVITLLIGLSSLFYFQRNEAELMRPLPEIGVAAVDGQAMDKNNNGSKGLDIQPEKNDEESPAKQEPIKKNQTNKAVSNISKAASASNNLVQNEIELADEAALIRELETDPLQSVAYTALDQSLVAEKTRYSITVKLPVVETYYGPDTTQPANQRFSKKLWTYASSQFERVMAGEKPQWPETQIEPEIAFNVPRIFK